MAEAKKFKKKYFEIDTWGEMDDLVRSLTPTQRKKLYGSLKVTQKFIGAEMRAEFMMPMLKRFIEEDEAVKKSKLRKVL